MTHWASLLALVPLFLLPLEVSIRLAASLSFLHFSASLVLFYSQPELRRSHPVVGFALPAALLVLLGSGSLVFPGFLAKSLVFFFALLFWHYAKQSYGIFVLSFRGRGGLDDPHSPERQRVLACFLWFALFGFLSIETRQTQTLSFGLYVPTLGLPAAPVAWIGRTGAALGLLYCAWVCRRYHRWEPLLTVLATWLWVDLSLTDFRLALLLPALHAIQYLPLVYWRVRARPGAHWPAWVGAWGFLGAGMYALFRLSPATSAIALGAVGLLELTVNLQHYFIDAYIWRARSAPIREALGIARP